MEIASTNVPRPEISITKITDDIYIGNCFAAKDPETLRLSGIRSVVSLDGTHTDTLAAELGVDMIKAYTLIDGDGNGIDLFKRAVAAVGRCLKSSGPVLVHCQAGRSRSVAVVAGYLASTGRCDGVDAAFELISSKRATTVMSPLKQLARLAYG